MRKEEKVLNNIAGALIVHDSTFRIYYAPATGTYKLIASVLITAIIVVVAIGLVLKRRKLPKKTVQQ